MLNYYIKTLIPAISVDLLAVPTHHSRAEGLARASGPADTEREQSQSHGLHPQGTHSICDR